MGCMVMGYCEDKQIKSYIVQTDYTHFQGIYERLQFGDVYTPWISSKDVYVWKNRFQNIFLQASWTICW